MLATLDHLAPGRVILGAGVGWMKEEIELFGVPYKRRGAWSDEAIRVMKACWRDERVSHRGEFVRFEGLGVARVSVGSGPTHAAMTLTRKIGEELMSKGTYEFLDGVITYPEANALIGRRNS